MAKPALDKDLKKLTRLEGGIEALSQQLVPFGLGFLFLVAAGLFAAGIVGIDGRWAIVVAATVIGGYTALNIGANDVANNMSPAVGSRVFTIASAVAIAAFFEAAGAILAGGDVVTTVSSRIIAPEVTASAATIVTLMVAALFAGALWINLATWIGAPVSTTHSVVGGVLGGGLAVGGLAAVNWNMVLQIVASWVISPALGGLVAAALLYYIKRTILNAPDKLAAARQRVPLLLALMGGAFTTYLLMKALRHVYPVPFWLALLVGIVAGILVHVTSRPYVARRLHRLPDRKASVGELFTLPVIFGAVLLSFAHGANDVANAIGPLAAIHAAVAGAAVGPAVGVPIWVLVVGALGISAGLALYGPRLIRTVGHKITKLNRVRAYCVTLSAAVTVIVASALGLPVSSTHIALGSLFGVGFLREILANNGRPDRSTAGPEAGGKKALRKRQKRRLVRRSHLMTIVAAWVVTVPASAALAALITLGIANSGIIVLD
ncbi:MAG: inorganic phosphate transporter [Rhodothalassiaceae bacterium]